MNDASRVGTTRAGRPRAARSTARCPSCSGTRLFVCVKVCVINSLIDH
jgi:hypothetical protein